MIEFNWKRVLTLIAIVILLVFTLCICTSNALTFEEYQQLYEKGVNAPMASDEMIAQNGTVEIHQMDTIYWWDAVDVALVDGWYDKLYHESSGKIVDVSAFSHKILIDPEVFPIGTWRQWSQYGEDSGNTIAFYVQAKRPAPIGNVSPLVIQNVTLKPYIQPLAVKKVTDVLVARGDSLSIAFKKSKIWIFGTNSGLYDFMTVNDAIVINKSLIQRLEPGRYTLLAEFPNNVTNNFNVRYDTAKDRLEYFDPAQFKIIYVDLAGLDPKTRLEKFLAVRNSTRDSFIQYELTVEDPKIEIASLDQVYINQTTFAQTVRGYTNVALGTELTFRIDKDKGKRFNTFSTVAKGSGNPGEMRWFEITIPLLWDNFAAGSHTIEGSTAIGGSQSVTFDVHVAPEHSFIPNNTIKYVNGSEWKEPVIIKETVTIILPTPTPVTIIQTVTVPPPQESVNEAQYQANIRLAQQILVLVVGAALVIGMLWYSRSVYCRYRDRKKGDRP